MKVGSGHRPVMACRRSAPTRSTSRASSPAGRPSYQASTGAVGRPARSSSTPASPMLATATERMRAGRSIAGDRTPDRRHRGLPQRLGVVLALARARPAGRRRRGALGDARPAGSKAMARMRLVPASTPRRSGSAKGLSRAGGRPRPRLLASSWMIARRARTIPAGLACCQMLRPNTTPLPPAAITSATMRSTARSLSSLGPPAISTGAVGTASTTLRKPSGVPV